MTEINMDSIMKKSEKKLQTVHSLPQNLQDANMKLPVILATKQ